MYVTDEILDIFRWIIGNENVVGERRMKQFRPGGVKERLEMNLGPFLYKNKEKGYEVYEDLFQVLQAVDTYTYIYFWKWNIFRHVHI